MRVGGAGGGRGGHAPGRASCASRAPELARLRPRYSRAHAPHAAPRRAGFVTMGKVNVRRGPIVRSPLVPALDARASLAHAMIWSGSGVRVRNAPPPSPAPGPRSTPTRHDPTPRTPTHTRAHT